MPIVIKRKLMSKAQKDYIRSVIMLPSKSEWLKMDEGSFKKEIDEINWALRGRESNYHGLLSISFTKKGVIKGLERIGDFKPDFIQIRSCIVNIINKYVKLVSRKLKINPVNVGWNYVESIKRARFISVPCVYDNFGIEKINWNNHLYAKEILQEYVNDFPSWVSDSTKDIFLSARFISVFCSKVDNCNFKECSDDFESDNYINNPNLLNLKIYGINNIYRRFFYEVFNSGKDFMVGDVRKILKDLILSSVKISCAFIKDSHMASYSLQR